MDFYEEDDAFYLVMEYMCGGDVFDRLVTLTIYTENDARLLVERLLKAVASLHKAGIAHRDLKPQNLLLKDNATHTEIKVADFGFSRRCHTPESLTTRYVLHELSFFFTKEVALKPGSLRLSSHHQIVVHFFVS